MTNALNTARDAIYAYAHGMDTGNWDLAAGVVVGGVTVDYSAVGMGRSSMSRQDLSAFLQTLLGKPELRVHTAISQVMIDPSRPGEYIAYYSVRHYRGPVGQARKFAVFGWYRFTLDGDKIDSLKIEVTDMEGEPSVLA